MEKGTNENILKIIESQRSFFKSGRSLPVTFRKQMLLKLLNAIEANEKDLSDALWEDMHKSYEEAYLTEFSIVKEEIRCHLKHLLQWSARKKASTPLKLQPARSYIVKEPLGNTLIISPWNYPVQLLLCPLIGAISAGCTAVLKPSPYVPNVSAALAKMIKGCFNEEYIAVIQGNREVNTLLLEQRWDLIFFTGSPSLGKTVMAAAAKNLTPVILELGGKSPCIIDKSASIEIASRRIAWGKTLNCGQTCIAPDYIIIHKDVKERFIKAFKEELDKLHRENNYPANNKIFPDRYYAHIINEKAFDRLVSYLNDGKIIFGGKYDRENLLIEPTLIDIDSCDVPVMQEEIFGPILPLITFDETTVPFKDKVLEFLKSKEKPLALYYFGKEEEGWDIIAGTSSGGGCINDVIMHIANENLPFGGVGNSGMGHYHNKESFECFSHSRSILCSGTWPDFPFRYMPYRFFSLIKKIV